MPWHVGSSSECPSSKPYAVIKDSDGSVEACHETREEAERHMAALYANEPAPGRAQMTAAKINDLPDSAFAYIEPGGKKDESGKTVPRSKRHFPIHDAAHVRNALARAPQSPFGQKAMPKILAAAKKFGIHVAGQDRSDSPMPEIERRYTLVPVEVRATGDRRTIGGYAAKFNRVSRDLGGFVEQVAPTFFNKSRGDGWPGVLARYNHNDNMLLGTVAGGTLRLNVDETGLLYEVDLPSTRADVFELVERRDVSQSSFAFLSASVEDDWDVSDQGYPLRTLISGRAVDVAPVNSPAYLDTSAALRSLAEKMSADPDEVRMMAEQRRLIEFFTRTDGPRPKQKVFGTAALLELKAKQLD